MIYYKCIDDFNIYDRKKSEHFDFIENELFTQKELLKITQNLKSVNVKFKKINISKRKIYWFFGSRQEI